MHYTQGIRRALVVAVDDSSGSRKCWGERFYRRVEKLDTMAYELHVRDDVAPQRDVMI
jgi:hypothetical protein